MQSAQHKTSRVHSPRVRAAAIVATLLLPAVALGQASAPNAIGLWRSNSSTTTGLTFNQPVGTVDCAVFSCLPPAVLTYYKPQPPQGTGARELDLRAVEFRVNIPNNPSGATVVHDLPKIEIRKAIPSIGGTTGRLLPDMSPTGLLVQFPQTIQFSQVPGAGSRTALVSLQLAAPLAVPAGTSDGGGLCFRMTDIHKQYGTASILPGFASSSGTTAPTLSGFQFPGQPGGFLDGYNLELAVTWYFEQPMLAPMRNATLQAPSSSMIGGTVIPPVVTAAVLGDDGHQALAPLPGDSLSYTVNSGARKKYGSGVGSPWIVPLVLFDGDAIGEGLVGPAPETWLGMNSVSGFVHPVPLQRWLDDFSMVFGSPPGLGAALNPANSTLALWLGLDLSLGYYNSTILFNAFPLADISGGARFAGPELDAWDSVLAPNGSLGRNLANWVPGGKRAEMKNFTISQSGYTPLVGAPGVPGLGYVQYPANAPFLAGRAFYLQAWILDTASTGSPLPAKIVDVTNVLRIQL